MYKFESNLKSFRSPQGAVREGDPVLFHILVRRDHQKTPSILVERRTDYTSKFYMQKEMEWVGLHREFDVYETSLSINTPGPYYFSFLLGDENQTPSNGLIVYDSDFTTPSWAHGSIMYHVFVDRFYRSHLRTKTGNLILNEEWGGFPRILPEENGHIENNEFFGGNLDGIRRKLPYLSGLGVSILYLSPIFDAYSNHKYDTGDYFTIDPLFGTEESLRVLCEEASTLGIRVILDGVFSHSGSDSIYFNRFAHYDSVGAWQSRNSPYFDWYFFNNWPHDYKSWWGIETLPEFNKQNPDYQDFIYGTNGVLRYWQKTGVSGWRLDVADELPNEFLEKIREASRKESSDSLIIGEVWEDASDKYSYGRLKEYFCGRQLDSVTNYPLRSAIIHYLLNKDCSELFETMNFIIERYPPDTIHCLMNILGTHDTPRIRTVLEENLSFLKIAILLQMTLPGIPCIYYGDEAGLIGDRDPLNRACYPWGSEDREILSYYRELTEQRKKSPLLKKGSYSCLIHEKEYFVFERFDEKDRMMIGVNLSRSSFRFSIYDTEIEIPPESGYLYSG